LFGYVRAYFSFAPKAARIRRRVIKREVLITRDEPFNLPMLAGAQTTVSLDLGATCQVGKGWEFGAPLGAHANGALRIARTPAVSYRPQMLGAFLEQGADLPLLHVRTDELTDRVVSLDDLWGSSSAELPAQIAELDEEDRLDRFEDALLERLRPAPLRTGGVDVVGLARWARREPASMTVRRLADAAGVSRRHLTRLFHEVVGVTPKRFCRLARFHTGLKYAGVGRGVRWAQVAADLGYADQSHMISEFRELGGLTPECLAARRWFNPFILDARARFGRAWTGRDWNRPGLDFAVPSAAARDDGRCPRETAAKCSPAWRVD
jgi:AraC-like DNA-binding protein